MHDGNSSVTVFGHLKRHESAHLMQSRLLQGERAHAIRFTLEEPWWRCSCYSRGYIIQRLPHLLLLLHWTTHDGHLRLLH